MHRIDARELQSCLACEMISNPDKYNFVRCLRGSDISIFIRCWVERVAKAFNRFEAVFRVLSGRIAVNEWIDIMRGCNFCHKYLLHRARKTRPGSLRPQCHPLIKKFGSSDWRVNLLIKNNYIEVLGTKVWSCIPQIDDAIITFNDEEYLCGP